MIEATNIIKKFGAGERELRVLKGLSLAVSAGEFVSITGRSGSGKSTLLYQLGLLDRPNEGAITIAGVATGKLSDDERTRFRLLELGYVFQDYALLPELSALENVAVPLMMRGLKPEAVTRQASEALERLGLKDRLHNLPSQLSGGEQQRVSIARAIAHHPKIIFADEPTANLDSETAKAVLRAFLDLHAAGQTIVMVTHEPEYAALTNRVLTLSDGLILA